MSDLFLDRDAVISPCGRYRYRLSRIWDHQRLPLPWIMLNPSTADATLDDPTIRRCMGFARREGHGGIVVLNLFALRSPNPKALREADDPIGPDNDRWIREVLHPHDRVVAAWGEGGRYLGRDSAVLKNLRASGIRIQCLGGKPKHPLYLRADLPFDDLDARGG